MVVFNEFKLIENLAGLNLQSNLIHYLLILYNLDIPNTCIWLDRILYADSYTYETE